MSRYLVEHDGLFLGSSSACNLVASIKFVKQMGWRNGERVVTILCVCLWAHCRMSLTLLSVDAIPAVDITPNFGMCT